MNFSQQQHYLLGERLEVVEFETPRGLKQNDANFKQASIYDATEKQYFFNDKS